MYFFSPWVGFMSRNMFSGIILWNKFELVPNSFYYNQSQLYQNRAWASRVYESLINQEYESGPVLMPDVTSCSPVAILIVFALLPRLIVTTRSGKLVSLSVFNIIYLYMYICLIQTSLKRAAEIFNFGESYDS